MAAFAADFGEVQLQSGLGEPFRAVVVIGGVSSNAMVPSCFRAKIETATGALLTNPRIEFDRFDGNRNTVQVKLSSFAPIAEPAIKLTLELICDSAVLRAYPLLLDFPEMRNQVRPRAVSIHGPTQSQARIGYAVLLRDEPDGANTASRHTTKLDYQLTSLTSEALPEQQQRPSALTMWIPVLVIVMLILIAAIVAVIFLIKNMFHAEKKSRSLMTAKSPAVKEKQPQRSIKPASAPVVDQVADDSMSVVAERHVNPADVTPIPAKLPTSAFNLFANREGQSIEIEEISDAVQEAQFWLSINKPERAIEILEPQCVDDNPPTPVMWLLLLDVYRAAQDQENFARLRQRFKQKFNTHILGMNESAPAHSVKFLCDFEHLTGKLAAFWNTNYILPFLESLLIDDREGERVGFELSVYQDILMLIAIAKELDKERGKVAAL